MKLVPQSMKLGKMAGSKKLPLYVYYLTTVQRQKFQCVFFVVVKEKELTFSHCKKSFTFNEFFFIRRQLSDLFDLQRVYHLKNFMSITSSSPKHNENLYIQMNKEFFCWNYISFLKFFLVIVLQRKKSRWQKFAANNFYLESNFSSNCLLLPIISRAGSSSFWLCPLRKPFKQQFLWFLSVSFSLCTLFHKDLVKNFEILFEIRNY